MKAMTRNLLAGAVLAVLPMGGALACTTTAWNGGTTAATAGDPTTGVARYSGACALEPAAVGNGHVTDNSPSNVTDYRARFYVYTGTASGNPVIFEATAADGNAGAKLVQVTYDTTNNQFDFAANGANGSASGIQDNKWYSVEIYYKQSGAFTAVVQGAGSATPTPVPITGTSLLGTVESARLGVLTAATAADTMKFDEFESTQSTTTAIGRLCRGDSNASGGITSSDRTAITLELGLPPTIAEGQPDCNEDGRITASDRTCVTQKLALFDPVAQCQ
jgi:hypothetical protein